MCILVSNSFVLLFSLCFAYSLAWRCYYSQRHTKFLLFLSLLLHGAYNRKHWSRWRINSYKLWKRYDLSLFVTFSCPLVISFFLWCLLSIFLMCSSFCICKQQRDQPTLWQLKFIFIFSLFLQGIKGVNSPSSSPFFYNHYFHCISK